MSRNRAAVCAEGAPRLLAALAALAVLAVLVQGIADVLPGGTSTTRVAAAASTSSGPADTSMQAPDAHVVARGSTLAAVPAPAGPAAGALPGAGPLVAPHLVAQPAARPPTAVLTAAAPGAPGSRAPPPPAGT